jgi:hypothetical protein
MNAMVTKEPDEKKYPMRECPFCGCAAHKVKTGDNDYWVQCSGCGACGPRRDTAPGAVDAWDMGLDSDLPTSPWDRPTMPPGPSWDRVLNMNPRTLVIVSLLSILFLLWATTP